MSATHYGVVFISRRQLRRSRHTIWLHVRVLDDVLERHPGMGALLEAATG